MWGWAIGGHGNQFPNWVLCGRGHRAHPNPTKTRLQLFAQMVLRRLGCLPTGDVYRTLIRGRGRDALEASEDLTSDEAGEVASSGAPPRVLRNIKHYKIRTPCI